MFRQKRLQSSHFDLCRCPCCWCHIDKVWLSCGVNLWCIGSEKNSCFVWKASWIIASSSNERIFTDNGQKFFRHNQPEDVEGVFSWVLFYSDQVYYPQLDLHIDTVAGRWSDGVNATLRGTLRITLHGTLRGQQACAEGKLLIQVPQCIKSFIWLGWDI